MTTPNPAFLCRYAVDITLAAATPQTVDVPVNGAHCWLILVKNTGATNDVTAATIASRCRSPRLRGSVTTWEP